MEMEQMMERLVAATEKMDANLQEMRAGQELLKEETLAKWKPMKKGWMP
jgi:hypothetical protein